MATYVMSDIHGLKDRFDEACKMFDLTKDHIYVLGDAIDRGKYGIDILQFLMNHKENFSFLLGNHELMMLNYIDSIGTDQENNYFMNWLMNGCAMTLGSFNNLEKEEQDKIINYLRKLPLAYPNVKVNDRTFYLVHGAPVDDVKDDTILYEDEIERVNDFVWKRCEHHIEIPGKTVIFGHTISYYYQEEVKPYKIWFNRDTLENSTLINIDCGCAARDENSNLCVLCLDTMKEYYF